MRKTKIICTLGPATDDPKVLQALIENGMDIARFNFSHGEYSDHLRRAAELRSMAKKLDKNIALMMDSKGPEIRLGLFENGNTILHTGDTFILTPREVEGTAEIAQVSYADLPQYVTAGDIIFLDDGNITLQVERVDENIHCLVLDGGEVSNRKKVTIPDVETGLPAVTEQDIADISFASEQKFDYIAASFLRSADHVFEIRKILDDLSSPMKIISKIENREGLNNIREIIDASDGIMIARGDLGVEIPQEEVPLRQKELVALCRAAGKPVIIATQMLDSMMRNPRPTRAEAGDVANAIFEGADAVMLSGETAVGHFPVDSLKTMVRIADITEAGIDYTLMRPPETDGDNNISDAIGRTVCELSELPQVKAIVTPTQSGFTAKRIAKYRPKVPIIAVTPLEHVYKELKLIWGVEPLISQQFTTTDGVLEDAVTLALSKGLVQNGDLLILTAGVPVAIAGGTNLIKLHTIGAIAGNGLGVGNKSVSGKVFFYRDGIHSPNPKEMILITDLTDEIPVEKLQQYKAIVTTDGGLSSHAVLFGINYHLPVIVNVQNLDPSLENGDYITLDCESGLIYSGKNTIL